MEHGGGGTHVCWRPSISGSVMGGGLMNGSSNQRDDGHQLEITAGKRGAPDPHGAKAAVLRRV